MSDSADAPHYGTNATECTHGVSLGDDCDFCNACYAHAINVNIAGAGKHPIVALWCMDCLVTVQEFDQVNAWAEIQRAVTEHCSQPSKREVLTRVAPPIEGAS